MLTPGDGPPDPELADPEPQPRVRLHAAQQPARAGREDAALRLGQPPPLPRRGHGRAEVPPRQPLDGVSADGVAAQVPEDGGRRHGAGSPPAPAAVRGGGARVAAGADHLLLALAGDHHNHQVSEISRPNNYNDTKTDIYKF